MSNTVKEAFRGGLVKDLKTLVMLTAQEELEGGIGTECNYVVTGMTLESVDRLTRLKGLIAQTQQMLTRPESEWIAEYMELLRHDDLTRKGALALRETLLRKLDAWDASEDARKYKELAQITMLQLATEDLFPPREPYEVWVLSARNNLIATLQQRYAQLAVMQEQDQGTSEILATVWEDLQRSDAPTVATGGESEEGVVAEKVNPRKPRKPKA